MLKALRVRIARPHSREYSPSGRIAAGFIHVAVYVVLAKAVGAGKEVAIAWRYGVSPEVDAYNLVLNLVTLPAALWTSVLAVVLVPLASALMAERPIEFQRFQCELLGVSLVVSASLGALAWIGLPWLFQSGLLGSSPEIGRVGSAMARSLAILIPLSAACALFASWLLARGQHQNSLYEALPALTILVAVLLPLDVLDSPLVWGTVAGFLVHAAVLTLSLRSSGHLVRPAVSLGAPAWRTFIGAVSLMAIGQGMLTVTTSIDHVFASELSAGSVSTLGYANRTLGILIAVGATAIARSTLHVFSAESAAGNDRVMATALSWSKGIFLVGIACSVLAWFIAPHLVAALFQRGSFNSMNTTSVTEVFRFGLLQVPFYLAGLSLYSALSADRQYVKMAAILLICAGVKILASWTLVQYGGLAGLQVATMIMYALFLFLQAALCIAKRRNP